MYCHRLAVVWPLLLHLQVIKYSSQFSSSVLFSPHHSFWLLLYALAGFVPLSFQSTAVAPLFIIVRVNPFPFSPTPGSLNLSLSQLSPTLPSTPLSLHRLIQHSILFRNLILLILFHLLTPLPRWPRSVASSSSWAMVPAVRLVCSCKYSDIRTAHSASPSLSPP